MERTPIPGTDRTDASDLNTLEYYLPATPILSTEPGRIERLLTTLFRRRDSYRHVDENADKTVWR